jgi:tetratricopeptide (TPR) repeat protein
VWQRIVKWDKALPLWIKLEEWLEVGRCFENLGIHKDAAEMYLKGGDTERAVVEYKKINDYQSLHRIYREADDSNSALDVLVRGNHLQEAGDFCMETGMYSEAEGIWSELKNKEKLIEVYLELKNYARAIQFLHESGETSKAYDIWFKHCKDHEVLIKDIDYADTLRKIADKLSKENRDIDAIPIWELLDDNQKLASAHEKLGNFKYAATNWRVLGEQESEYSEQIKCFSKALELNPEEKNCYALRGRAYLEDGKYNLSLIDYNNAIKQDSNNSDNFLYRAINYSWFGNKEKVLENYNQAIKLNPQEPRYFLARGMWYTQENELDSALEDINKAILLDNEAGELYQQRGLIFIRKQDFDNAEADLRLAQDLGINNSVLFEAISLIYEEKGDLKLESENLEKAMQYSNCSVDVFLKFGDICMDLKKYHQGIKCLDLGISLFPEESRFYHVRSVMNYEKRQFNSALNDASKAILLNEDIPEFFSVRSLIYETFGNKELAKRDADKAHELENRVKDKENIDK